MPWTKVLINKEELEADITQKGLRALSFVEALNEAHAQLMEKDESVLIMGEGVDDPGAVFGSTKDLLDRFGKDRVMDTPLAENGLTGIAAGAAMAGLKPIFIHMRMDFLPMCMDQIINHAAKWHYMSGGKVHVPLVIRSIIGRGWGSAAQHSQALHSMFLSIPGLKIVMPSTPYDVKGLMIAAVNDGNPILFIEHRWLYGYSGYVPEEMYEMPMGKGIVRKEGKDVTIVAISIMVYEAMKAAKMLSEEGIDVEVIDPRTIKPLDEELIINSVKKTGRLLIADLGCKTGSCGAEIATRVVESDAFSALKSSIVRINFPDAPTPCSSVLEEAYYPSAETIAESIRNMLK